MYPQVFNPTRNNRPVETLPHHAADHTYKLKAVANGMMTVGKVHNHKEVEHLMFFSHSPLEWKDNSPPGAAIVQDGYTISWLSQLLLLA